MFDKNVNYIESVNAENYLAYKKGSSLVLFENGIVLPPYPSLAVISIAHLRDGQGTSKSGRQVPRLSQTALLYGPNFKEGLRDYLFQTYIK